MILTLTCELEIRRMPLTFGYHQLPPNYVGHKLGQLLSV